MSSESTATSGTDTSRPSATDAEINELHRQVPWESHQIVLILCGLIGSGKSTFATDLQRYFPQFIRCNQDDLGNRRNVEELAQHALRDGLSVCIDRTNFNASQRSYWIEIARKVPGTLIWLIVFDTPYEICAARLLERTEHPTIKTPEQGLSVLARFANDFQYPHPNEGHHRIIYLNSEGQPAGPAYSRSEVNNILQRLWNSVPVTPLGLPVPRSFTYTQPRNTNHFRYRHRPPQ